jgi:hypothetical protein
MKTGPATELEVGLRHLQWTAESLQRAAGEVEGPTYRGALAVALGDCAHLQRQLQTLLLTINAGGGGEQ